MYPTSLVALQRFQVVKYDIYKRVKNTFCRRDAIKIEKMNLKTTIF